MFSSKLLASKSTRVVACFVFLAVSFSATIPLQAQTPHAAAWGKLSPATPFPTRTAFASAYDPVSKKIVIFGGTDEVDQFSDTWTFDGSTWTQVDTSVSPGPRADAAMAYDTKTQKLVMFGGFVGLTLLNDTWLWDGATSTWTQASPTTVPKAATNPSLFRDPINGHVDMFGGYQGQFYSRSM